MMWIVLFCNAEQFISSLSLYIYIYVCVCRFRSFIHSPYPHLFLLCHTLSNKQTNNYVCISATSVALRHGRVVDYTCGGSKRWHRQDYTGPSNSGLLRRQGLLVDGIRLEFTTQQRNKTLIGCPSSASQASQQNCGRPQ